MSETDPYAAVTEEAHVSSFAPAGESEEFATPAPVAEPVTEEAVPEGSVKDVLAWVGEDSAKAQRALDAENAGEGRKTLVSKLNEIIN